MIPRGATKVDWEVELGIVIGRATRSLSDPSEARAQIAGLVLANDVSERHAKMERGSPWVKGMSLKSFCPFGP